MNILAPYATRRIPLEFNEKLQQLRKQKNFTQEQLAEELYVSRTAISKWESGKGYPNIESLKRLSKLFSVSIDELLSGEELINLAETENWSSVSKIYNTINAVLDLLAIAFVVLPLYGNPVNGYIYSVNLMEFTATTPINLTIYWIVFATLIGLGIIQLVALYNKKERLSHICGKCSFAFNFLAVCFFAAAREPYVTTLVFLFLMAKVALLIKTNKISKRRL